MEWFADHRRVIFLKKGISDLRSMLFAGTALLPVSFAADALAQSSTSSTETYVYDALGRVVSVTTAGGQNDGEAQELGYDDAGNRITYETSTGAAPPPPPPPPPPPMPTTTEITDMNLNVLQAHQSTYSCSMGSYWGYSWEFCSLNSNGVIVFDANASPTFDPGYSMPTPKKLQVATAAYGTGVAP